jgi:hypothetical protein
MEELPKVAFMTQMLLRVAWRPDFGGLQADIECADYIASYY